MNFAPAAAVKNIKSAAGAANLAAFHCGKKSIYRII